MAAYYFDSSALAKRYLREAHTDAVLRWLAQGDAVTARLSLVEIASAMARRRREGALSLDAYQQVSAALRHDSRTLRLVELGEAVTARSLSLLANHPLRASDVVQLASCLYVRDLIDPAVTFACFDERLRAAASAEGLDLLP